MSAYPVRVGVESVDDSPSCEEDYGFRIEAEVVVDGHPHTVRVTANYGDGYELDDVSGRRAKWLLGEIVDFLRARP